ncbi:MAG: phage holin family protein [Patescibacteria group bacterium]|jgi:putative membrane protein
MKFIIRLVINALFILVSPLVFSGVIVAGFWTALVIVVFLGLVNAIIRPLLIILTLPINIVTLGLFTLVINGLLVLLVSSVVKGFYVSDLWTAVGLSLFLWIGSWFSNYLVSDNKLAPLNS